MLSHYLILIFWKSEFNHAWDLKKNDISMIPMQEKTEEATKKLLVKDIKSLIKQAMEPFNHL